MQIATGISARLSIAGGAERVPASEILLNGVPTGKQVKGAMLEAAIQWKKYYLLFMTDDVPFEDMLSIHLLDAQFDVLDSAVMGAPYSSGTFACLSLIAPDTVEFRFAGDTVWSVEMLEAPERRIPFVSDPPGVKRPFGFSRYFRIHGNPRPEIHGCHEPGDVK